MFSRVRAGLAACCTALNAGAANVATDAAHARSLAATCASCHASSSSAGSVIAALEGASESSIAQAMRDFKDGRRAGTVMPQLAKGYTDEQIQAIARWYAARTR